MLFDSQSYKLYTDGGARGNPGHAGAGVVLQNPAGQTIQELNKYLGHATNNEAEYIALQLGLEVAKQKKVTVLSCFLDSELVVKQINGQYKVKSAHLVELHNKIKKLEKHFSLLTYTHVKRSENKRADQLVNMAIDDFLGLK